MSSKTNNLARTHERLIDCLDELDDCKTDLSQWVDSLEELSAIEDAFGVEEENRLHGKTILDVGTDCVKPLYIALKFEPDKIIGINEYLSSYSFASDLEQKSRLFTKTKIHLYNCSFFDEVGLRKIQKKETFDFVLVSKSLHHLRAGECIREKRDPKHECREDEESCIYKFEEEKIFERLLQLGKRVIIYEWYDPTEKDDDKVRGRGGYFTVEEWKRIFSYLSKKHRAELIKPSRCQLREKELEKKLIPKLRQVDYICFYVETK